MRKTLPLFVLLAFFAFSSQAHALIVELSSNETNMSSGQHGIMWIRLTNNDTMTVNATVILPRPGDLKAYEMSFIENGGIIISKTLAKDESSRTILIRVMSFSEGTEPATITIEKFMPPSSSKPSEVITKKIKFSSVMPVSFDELSPISMAALLVAAAIIFYIFSARPERRE
jgi:hypothetical protein